MLRAEPGEQRVESSVAGEHEHGPFSPFSTMRPISKAMWKSRALGPTPLERTLLHRPIESAASNSRSKIR